MSGGLNLCNLKTEIAVKKQQEKSKIYKKCDRAFFNGLNNFMVPGLSKSLSIDFELCQTITLVRCRLARGQNRFRCALFLQWQQSRGSGNC